MLVSVSHVGGTAASSICHILVLLWFFSDICWIFSLHDTLIILHHYSVKDYSPALMANYIGSVFPSAPGKMQNLFFLAVDKHKHQCSPNCETRTGREQPPHCRLQRFWWFTVFSLQNWGEGVLGVGVGRLLGNRGWPLKKKKKKLTHSYLYIAPANPGDLLHFQPPGWLWRRARARTSAREQYVYL